MTEPITIAGCDLDLTIKFVREIAAEHPDRRNLTRIRVPGLKEQTYVSQPIIEISAELPYVNSACYFDAQGQPSCIVGHALHRQGISAADLTSTQNTASVYSLAGALYGSARRRNPKLIWLRDVQVNQDRGFVWQQAVHFADIRLPEVAK